jgi:hypothetical protein
MHFDGKVREGEEMVEAAREELRQAKERKSVAAAATTA